MVYSILTTYELHRACSDRDKGALEEWKVRWGNNYPKMGDGDEIQASSNGTITHFIQPKECKNHSIETDN